MGLFSKELRDYKILEKYKKKLDDFYSFGETERYRLFLDKRLNQYILRQDKQNPKNVVYLGWLRGEKCVFYGRIFFINKLSYTGRQENPLNYIDVETGCAGSLPVLSSKGCFLAMHWHCQDVVNKFEIRQDAIVIEGTRYKEDAHDEKECTYCVYIRYKDGLFQWERETYELSEEKTMKQLREEDNKETCICEPVKKQPGLIYGDDIALQPKVEEVQTAKVKYDVESVACGLAELALKELVDLMGLCGKFDVAYDERSLIIATFAYYYEVWLFNFASITVAQAEKVEAIYKEKFSAFNRKQFEEDSYKSVLENETRFEQMLREVDRRIRDSYHKNNKTFLDDGLTDEFISLFVTNPMEKDSIKGYVANKIFEVWAYTAREAEKQMDIE